MAVRAGCVVFSFFLLSILTLFLYLELSAYTCLPLPFFFSFYFPISKYKRILQLHLFFVTIVIQTHNATKSCILYFLVFFSFLFPLSTVILRNEVVQEIYTIYNWNRIQQIFYYYKHKHRDFFGFGWLLRFS